MTTAQIENMEDAAITCFNAHVTSYNPINSMKQCLIICREQLTGSIDELARVFVDELIIQLEDELFIIRELPKF